MLATRRPEKAAARLVGVGQSSRSKEMVWRTSLAKGSAMLKYAARKSKHITLAALEVLIHCISKGGGASPVEMSYQ
jgi:hypothetical protein